jgi:hypothetical protein
MCQKITHGGIFHILDVNWLTYHFGGCLKIYFVSRYGSNLS